MIGEPDAGKPPVRFDEGVQETCDIAARLCPTLRLAPFGDSQSNPLAYELARRLSDPTGESLTSTVIHTLESKLAEEERRRAPTVTAEKILTFAERFSSGMPKGCDSADHATLLYGEDGLPR